MAATDRAPSLALPLNQGKWGTCAAHAFANAVSSGLIGKYDLAIEREKIVDMLLQQPETTRVREGIDIKDICVGWNRIMEKPYTWIDDTNKINTYKFKVTSEICSSTTEFVVDQIDNINDAYQELSIFQAAEIQILTHITIPGGRGHTHHAVSAFRAYDTAPNMRAMNSWGAVEPTLDVTTENFVKCIFLNVVVTKKQSSSSDRVAVTEQLPVTTLAWKEAYSKWSKKLIRITLSKIYQAGVDWNGKADLYEAAVVLNTLTSISDQYQAERIKYIMLCSDKLNEHNHPIGLLKAANTFLNMRIPRSSGSYSHLIFNPYDRYIRMLKLTMKVTPVVDWMEVNPRYWQHIERDIW
jgi:hypothetical protein